MLISRELKIGNNIEKDDGDVRNRDSAYCRDWFEHTSYYAPSRNQYGRRNPQRHIQTAK